MLTIKNVLLILLFAMCPYTFADTLSFNDLSETIDLELQTHLNTSLARLNAEPLADKGRLSVTLVDISNLEYPRMAHINGTKMLYAASLPKIAIMLGVFDRIKQGLMAYDEPTEAALHAMIRNSSNSAATDLYQQVGVENLIDILQDDAYQFYDADNGGGLWVGKPYSSGQATHRDPLHNISHGATAFQVARFFYLIESNQLVDADYCPLMKDILANPGISHKFVKGLKAHRPDARIYRKSGTWSEYHADGALIERPDGRKYIAVGLVQDPNGGKLLEQLIVELDQIIDKTDAPAAPVM